MYKLRAVLGVIGMLCALGIAAAPALALFEGEKAETGPLGAGDSSIRIPGALLACSKAEGAWVVWSKAETKVDNDIIQAQDTKGPHLYIAISKWGGPNGCEVETAAGAEKTEMRGCVLQYKQPTSGELTATVDVASECVTTTAAGCIIKIPQANTTNENLKAIALKNNGTSLEAKVNVGGITANVNAICKAAGLSNTAEGIFTSVMTGSNLQEV